MKSVSQQPSDKEYRLAKQCCPVCGNSGTTVFFEVESVPVFCNALWETRARATAAPVAPIRLAHCRRCAMIYNDAFDPGLTRYSPAYENSLHFSPVFRKWAEETAERLVQRYRLREKDVIEIGCGQGDFLALMQRLGNNRVLGFDPSYDPKKNAGAAQRPEVTILPEAYSQAHVQYPADFVCCRHVLEHVHHPLDFLEGVRRAIGRNDACAVYFEVPNALYCLEQKGLWDIIYEHCSYFTSESLTNLFLRAGFEPIDVALRYGSQFLTIEARPAQDLTNGKYNGEWTIPNLSQLTSEFQRFYPERVSSWREELSKLYSDNSRIVIWGAGSKGVTFANTLSISHRQIEYIVDVNPRKSGKFIPGTGQQVVEPGFLKEHRPQVIIIMNPIYQTEIRQTVSQLGFNPRFLLA